MYDETRIILFTFYNVLFFDETSNFQDKFKIYLSYEYYYQSAYDYNREKDYGDYVNVYKLYFFKENDYIWSMEIDEYKLKSAIKIFSENKIDVSNDELLTEVYWQSISETLIYHFEKKLIDDENYFVLSCDKIKDGYYSNFEENIGKYCFNKNDLQNILEILNKKENIENNSYIDGYDKVKWGALNDDILRVYNESNIHVKNEIDTEGNLILVHKFQDNNIMAGRCFFFHNEKLFKVSVWFDDIDNIYEEMLFDKYCQKYDFYAIFNKENWNDFENNNENINIKGKIYTKLVTKNLFIRIVVEDYINKNTNKLELHRVTYIYSNPVIEENKKNKKAKKDIDNISI